MSGPNQGMYGSGSGMIYQDDLSSKLRLPYGDPSVLNQMIAQGQAASQFEQSRLAALRSQPARTGLSPAMVAANNRIAVIQSGAGSLPTPYVAATGPTLTQQANRSPELEGQVQTYIDKLNNLSTGYQQAYQNKQNTFDDVIRGLANTYQTQASNASNAQGQAALNSGLSPLEARQLSGGAMEQLLQQFYPQQAGLRAQQADVGIASQQAQQGLATDYANMLAQVMAPYLKGVAGTQETNNFAREQLKESATMDRAKLSQAAQALQVQLQSQQSAQESDWNKALLQYQLGQQQMQQQAAQQAAQLQQAMQLAMMGQSSDLNKIALQDQGAMERAKLQYQQAMGTTGMQTQSDLMRQAMASQGQLANTQLSGETDLMKILQQNAGQMALQQNAQQYGLPAQESQIKYQNAMGEAALNRTGAVAQEQALTQRMRDIMSMISKNMVTSKGDVNQAWINQMAKAFPEASKMSSGNMFGLFKEPMIDPAALAQSMLRAAYPNTGASAVPGTTAQTADPVQQAIASGVQVMRTPDEMKTYLSSMPSGTPFVYQGQLLTKP